MFRKGRWLFERSSVVRVRMKTRDPAMKHGLYSPSSFQQHFFMLPHSGERHLYRDARHLIKTQLTVLIAMNNEDPQLIK
jgi:hypothetical protein